MIIAIFASDVRSGLFITRVRQTSASLRVYKKSGNPSDLASFSLKTCQNRMAAIRIPIDLSTKRPVFS
jgi:hypothetical protein